MMKKTIVTAAITGGVHTPSMSQHLPITPTEIADEAVRAGKAGAAVAHVHVRDPETGRPSADLGLYAEVLTRIKDRSDMIVCITTGGGLGQTVEQRVAPVIRFSPELASLNAGSLNFALFHALDSYSDFQFDWERQYLAATEEMIFPNTFRTLREFGAIFDAQGTKPEFEIYDVGMLNNLAFLLERGLVVRKPLYLQFVLGILGGLPATIQNVSFLYTTARELIGDFEWSVCAAGKTQFRMCTASLLMGGHVRVGLEDNLYLEKGRKAESNAEQVEKIIRIAKELEKEPATPEEARVILGLKGLESVRFS
jgi:3,5-dioxohexanoate:acetyl-CoA acetone transferase